MKPHLIRELGALRRKVLKQQMRHLSRNRRKAIPASVASEASQNLSLHLRQLWEAHHRPLVAVYAAIGSEISLAPFIEQLEALWCPIAYPRVHADLSMDFALAQRGELVLGPARTWQPDVKAPPITPGLILVPGLAFDRMGRRLGQGGGYYDRCLVSHREALWVGIAYRCQWQRRLPVERHDLRMDLIVTESEVWRVPQLRWRSKSFG